MALKLSEILSKGDFSPLKAHASTKKFYLGKFNEKKHLLIVFELGKEERENFLKLTNFLHSQRISVPKIVYSPDDEEPYLITDFVSGKLLSQTPFDEKIFEKAVEEAKKFSLIKYDSLQAIKFPMLDFKRIKYELDFFLLHFCEGFANERVEEETRKALYNLAGEVDSFPKSFCHRDYHSENIIVKEDNVFILDYQDALIAPCAYDFASLYVDGYFDFPKKARESIKNYALSHFGASEEEFLKTALQRLLKALGTFGFQIVHRKKAKYIASVIRSVNYLDEMTASNIVESEKTRNYLKALKNKITSELCG